MRVVAMWLGIDLRRRLRSLIVLAVLIALAGGTVMAAVAGARRGASALQRLESQAQAATTAVLPNQPGFDWAPVERLPDVASVSTFVINYSLSYHGLPADVAWFPTVNDTIFRSIERPAVLAGRVFRAGRPEAVVTPAFAARFHHGVGTTVVLDMATPRELVAGQGSGPGGSYTGPKVTLRIVGVIRTPWFADTPYSDGHIIMSPWVAAHYPASIIGDTRDPLSFEYVNALVRLRGGEADIPRFRQEIARVTGRPDIDILDLPAQYRATQRQITFESCSLLALAGAAFLAALFLLGQALARYAAVAASDLQTMRAIGLTLGQAMLCAAAGPAAAGLAGATAAAGGAVAASRWFPIGTAALHEPAPGVRPDWVVTGPGLVLIPVLVAAGAMLAVRLALRAAARREAARGSALAASAARAGLAAPVVIGIRFALEPGRGRTAVPARPALAGAVTGVLGVVAAFTFSHAVTDAASHPGQFGQTFQWVATTGINSRDLGPTAEVISALDQSRQVTGVDDARVEAATADRGHDSVTLYEYAPGPKPVPVVVFSGAMPRAASQVLLAPRTLAALHTRVGGRIRLAGTAGRSRLMRVTGTGLVPDGSHNSYADGGWVTSAGYQDLFTGFKFHEILITMAPRARTTAAGTALTARITRDHPALRGLQLDPADTPVEVAELLQVQDLPVVLGIFLALLAAGAVGHALITAARHRAPDIAVLRALGLSRRDCRLILATQSAVLAAAGLAAGIPAGLAAGRLVWHAVADYTPVQYVPPLAVGVLLTVAPATITLGLLLAAWPAHRAAHLQAARILHTE